MLRVITKAGDVDGGLRHITTDRTKPKEENETRSHSGCAYYSMLRYLFLFLTAFVVFSVIGWSETTTVVFDVGISMESDGRTSHRRFEKSKDNINTGCRWATMTYALLSTVAVSPAVLVELSSRSLFHYSPFTYPARRRKTVSRESERTTFLNLVRCYLFSISLFQQNQTDDDCTILLFVVRRTILRRDRVVELVRFYFTTLFFVIYNERKSFLG